MSSSAVVDREAITAAFDALDAEPQVTYGITSTALHTSALTMSGGAGVAA